MRGGVMRLRTGRKLIGLVVLVGMLAWSLAGCSAGRAAGRG